MEDANLKTYAMLARLGFPKRYLAKILLAAFLGTNVPLVALVIYLLADLFLNAPVVARPEPQLLVLLFMATLAGTAATLWVLRGLLAPIKLASSSLKGYLDDQRVPELPVGFSDEAGRLMANVQYAVENLDRTIRSLQSLSSTDYLTGLLNRREGEDRLVEDIARAERGSGELTVAVLDINKFKAINDAWGHQAGDVCIRHVADILRHNMREGDWQARWGGDEFVMVLWDTSAFASPETVLRRINADLRKNPVRLAQECEVLLSISAGACRYSGEEDFRELLSKADAAMYEAKREGRAWVFVT